MREVLRNMGMRFINEERYRKIKKELCKNNDYFSIQEFETLKELVKLPQNYHKQ